MACYGAVVQAPSGHTIRRPIYLVIALIAMWVMGMNAAADGYVVVKVIHNPLSLSTAGAGKEALATAFVRAVSQHPRVNLPLGIAQILLGGLLVLISIKALVARHASTSFALQVLAANALLVIVSYALRQPVRGAVVDAIVGSGLVHRPSGISTAAFQRLERLQAWWAFRILLGLQLAALGLCAFALTRKTAREVLAPAPRPEGH